jgi:hypothetical protein
VAQPPVLIVPRPMSVALRESIEDAVRAIPTGKKGQATAAVTNRGVQFDAGYQAKEWLSVGGYAARLWQGEWEAGAKATVTW